ncbi:MAG: HAMP domain-containing histidine kinase [Planctomycetes bacterium]|nr:HAMP domain-containing histidine kinase [Planctomycetota bacterium]
MIEPRGDEPAALQAALAAAERARIAAEEEAERLRAAVRVRDDLLSAAGHELRNPLNAMLIFADVVDLDLRRARSAPDPQALERLTPRLEALSRQIRQFSRRATVLLDVTQLGAGRLRLEPQEVDLGRLVGRLLDDLEPLAAASKTPLVRALAPGVVGRWDPLRLEQVAENLVSNALKFGQGRPVRVEVARTGDGRATLWVKDEGPGIAPQDRARLFQRFERGETAPDAASRAGFGVGLWIVAQLVAAMGGGVDVESTPGAGATFRVALPADSGGGA